MKILFNPLTDNKLCLIQKILQEKKLVGEISDDTVISPDMIDFLTDELTLRTGKCVKFKADRTYPFSFAFRGVRVRDIEMW